MDQRPEQLDESISSIVLDQAGRLFREHAASGAPHAADRDSWPERLWADIEAAGLPLALVPEQRGGVGLPIQDAMALVRLAAYHALPVPLAETMMALRLWSDAGGVVPEGVVTFAAPSDEVSAVDAEGVLALHGCARRVPWGAQGKVLLQVDAPSGGATLALADGASAGRVSRRNLASEPRDDLTFDGTAVAHVDGPGAGGWGDDLLTFGALIRSQQLVGAMERCLELAIEYANLRVQFGRPIGKFQAVQHMLAVAAGHVALATAAADEAIQAFDSPDFGFAVAIAKADCGHSASEVAAIAHQVHGAIGFTQEHSLHLLTRRLWSWREEFGSDTVWQERVGRRVCEAGGEALWSMLLRE